MYRPGAHQRPGTGEVMDRRSFPLDVADDVGAVRRGREPADAMVALRKVARRVTGRHRATAVPSQHWSIAEFVGIVERTGFSEVTVSGDYQNGHFPGPETGVWNIRATRPQA